MDKKKKRIVLKICINKIGKKILVFFLSSSRRFKKFYFYNIEINWGKNWKEFLQNYTKNTTI